MRINSLDEAIKFGLIQESDREDFQGYLEVNLKTEFFDTLNMSDDREGPSRNWKKPSNEMLKQFDEPYLTDRGEDVHVFKDRSEKDRLWAAWEKENQ